MMPILLGSYSKTGAVIMSPLFFGIAHFHHMIERIRRGQDVKTAFFISSFQFAYTTVFGMYSAFLFIRTGHLASCVIVHGFCEFFNLFKSDQKINFNISTYIVKFMKKLLFR